MCGIIGYVGHRPARAEVLRGLRRLEYRGYDSAGIAERSDASIDIVRAQGRVDALAEKLGNSTATATVAIGHTRWATHGPPCERNAHPHRDCAGEIAVVHNGIIENYSELREELSRGGHHFASDTDTEVISHLLEDLYEGDLRAAVRAVCARLQGNYALCILHARHEGMIVVRNGSPLVLGVGKGEFLCASDASALIEVTRDVIYLDDGDLAEVKREQVRVWGANGVEIVRELQHLDWSIEQIQRGRYDHFMRKEIEEQPRAITDVLAGRIRNDGSVELPEIAKLKAQGEIERVLLVGCGSSFHAAKCGTRFMEQMGLPWVRAEIGSELKLNPDRMRGNELVVLISQSGETADTLACLDLAESMNIPTLAICNVVGSSLARRASAVLFTQAGPEIAVASTKAFTCQVVSLALAALALGPDQFGREQLTRDLERLPDVVGAALLAEERLAALAKCYAKSKAAVFLGSGLGLAVAEESALKLAEISYIPAFSKAMGEMKHGPLALIEPSLLTVLVVHGKQSLHAAKVAHAEVTSRGGPCLVLGGSWDAAHDDAIELPQLDSSLGYLGPNLLAQLFAYHVARELGEDIDKPRNLAKSVTVA